MRAKEEEKLRSPRITHAGKGKAGTTDECVMFFGAA